MSFSILSPGLLTTVQDTGRWGYQKEGIIVSGAMDLRALRIANLLVGNPENSAAVEISHIGPTIKFTADHLISITGADLSPTINKVPVKLWRPIFVRKDSILAFGAPRSGSFAYLAVAGSFDVPAVMGSSATYLKAGFGGFEGKSLQAGDLLPCKGPAEGTVYNFKESSGSQQHSFFVQARWFSDPSLYLSPEATPAIRFIKGPEWELFSQSSQNYFLEEEFKLSPQSDRMGFRLTGPLLSLATAAELLSSAVTFGTVQVPASGNPIILMADRQTTGGYPRIAQVITTDLSKLAQLPTGKTIRFKEIPLQQAQHLLIAQERQLHSLKRALRFKLSSAV